MEAAIQLIKGRNVLKNLKDWDILKNIELSEYGNGLVIDKYRPPFYRLIFLGPGKPVEFTAVFESYSGVYARGVEVVSPILLRDQRKTTLLQVWHCYNFERLKAVTKQLRKLATKGSKKQSFGNFYRLYASNKTRALRTLRKIRSFANYVRKTDEEGRDWFSFPGWATMDEGQRKVVFEFLNSCVSALGWTDESRGGHNKKYSALEKIKIEGEIRSVYKDIKETRRADRRGGAGPLRTSLTRSEITRTLRKDNETGAESNRYLEQASRLASEFVHIRRGMPYADSDKRRFKLKK